MNDEVFDEIGLDEEEKEIVYKSVFGVNFLMRSPLSPKFPP